MRRSLASLLIALVLVTGILPWHRCTPAGSEGRGTTILFGAHAHDGPCDHEGDDHDCDEDGAPCCTDAPADPTAPPSGAGFEVAAPAPVPAFVVADAAVARSAPVTPTWHVPIRRPPTETVVLLR